jgi:hypothetical protein
MWVGSSEVLPSASRYAIGTDPSPATVRIHTSCFRSGRWSLEWPNVTAGVGLPRRAVPSASAYWPCTDTEVESLCICDVSMPNSPITPTISSVSPLARSASNRLTSARPTRSSLSQPPCPPGSPSSPGAYGAAHLPNPYSGARPTNRLTTSSRIAVAGASLNLRSAPVAIAPGPCPARCGPGSG